MSDKQIRKCFIVHTEYIEDLPEEAKPDFLLYIYNYAAKGEEPNLSGFEKSVWIKIKRRIDQDCAAYDKRIKNLRQNRSESTTETTESTTENDLSVGVSVSDSVSEFDSDAHAEFDGDGAPENGERLGYLSPKDFDSFLKGLYDKVLEHNKAAKREKRMPVSSSFTVFRMNEARELLATVGMREEPPGKVAAALDNFLKTARSDTWQQTFTWLTFCKHWLSYSPDFFALSAHMKAEPKTDDATKRPENVFFMANKDNPEFRVDIFRRHLDEWKAEGRPEGLEYMRLQKMWEAADAS